MRIFILYGNGYFGAQWIIAALDRSLGTDSRMTCATLGSVMLLSALELLLKPGK